MDWTQDYRKVLFTLPTSVSYAGLKDGDQARGQGTAMFLGRPCDPDPEAPLSAWDRGHALAHFLGPLSGESLDSRIRGLGSGVNSICFGSIQTESGSVLPATLNFLDKGLVEGPGKGMGPNSPGKASAARGTIPASELPLCTRLPFNPQ